jgi:hypothetical protein
MIDRIYLLEKKLKEAGITLEPFTVKTESFAEREMQDTGDRAPPTSAPLSAPLSDPISSSSSVRSPTTLVQATTKLGPSTFTHQNFLSMTLQSREGIRKLWWEIYFEKIHAKFPMYTQQWFEAQLTSIPLYVLHIMYATCLAYPEAVSKDKVGGDAHRDACLELMNGEYLESPNPWNVQAIILVAVYSVFTFRVKSGMSYLALVIRLAQTLGLDEDKELFYESNELPAPEWQNFGRCLWSCINSLDYYCYFLCGVDFMIPAKELLQIPAWSKVVQSMYAPKNRFGCVNLVI